MIGDCVKGIIQKRIKGGWLVRTNDGISAFMPITQSYLTQDTLPNIGQEIEAEVLTVKRNNLHKNCGRTELVISRLRFLKQAQKTLQKELFARIKAGDVLTGVVTKIHSFGVFIDLGGYEGLLHVSRTAAAHASHKEREQLLQEAFPKGGKVRVVVEFVDEERSRISLILPVNNDAVG